MYCGPPDQLPPCLLDLNWDQKMDPRSHFESGLSSVVPSSQSHSSPASAEGMASRKLMGGSQSVGNPGDGIAPQSHHIGLHLNSPPKLDLSTVGRLQQHQQAMGGLPVSGNPMPLTHLDQLSADPGFAERAARFSGGGNYGRFATTTGLQIGLPDGRKVIPVPAGLQLDTNNGELVNAREDSSVSDPASGEATLGGPAGSNAKKRKAPPPKGKGKDTNLANSAIDSTAKVAEDEDSGSKRHHSMEKNGNKNDAVKQKVKQNDGHKPEPPKDYIHVRARRGQATDNHSLAERVRREKISQRMKLLQDLVPGCNKVTGKAVMLDEIINYVQSLQQQVEFLSMKLATVNPHLDFNNLVNLLPKDMHETCGPIPSSIYSSETSGVTPPYVNQPQQGTSLHHVLPNVMETQSSVNLLDPTFHQILNPHQPFLSGFEGASSSQVGPFWVDDLQNVVHMDIGQN